MRYAVLGIKFCYHKPLMLSKKQSNSEGSSNSNFAFSFLSIFVERYVARFNSDGFDPWPIIALITTP